MESDLRRIGRWPALLLVGVGIAVAFLGLSSVGDDHHAKPNRLVHAAVPTRRVPPTASVNRSHPQVVEPPAGGSVVTGQMSAPTKAAKKRARPAATAAPATGDLRRAVGAKIMTAMVGSAPSADLLGRARRGEIGGVILFGNNVSGGLSASINVLQNAARQGGNPPLLIAVDQEGGSVRRLSSAPPVMSAAAMTPTVASAQGAATGQALAAQGINVNLAPVADVAAPGNFLGSRSFSSNPQQVARDACAFAAGLGRAGVAATFKHFPGLGRATRNTDQYAVSIPAQRSALEADLAAYRSCQPQLVMLSNAIYPALDPSAPAVFSSRIVRDLLRGELRFEGVTITDTLSAPGVAGPTAALRATRAGIDILLYTDPGVSARAFSELLSAAQSGAIARSAVMASAQRIHRLTS